MRLLEQRPTDLALYNAKVRQIVTTSQAALGVDEVAKAQALVAEMQHLLVGRLHVSANPTDSQIWAAHRAKLILHAVNDVVERYSKRFGVLLGKSVEDAYRDGADRTEELTRLSGAAWNLPAISEHEINIAARYSPDLIRGYDDYAKEKLGDVIKRFTLTGRPPAELMAELAGRIDTRGTPFHSIAYRAEIITRTEMARVAEMGSQARMLDFVQEFPDAGMQQIHLLSERACDDCQGAFDASPNGDGVWDVGDDGAPVFPLHPNCLCSMAPYFEGLSRKPERESIRIYGAGTSDGAKKGWDTRGRGTHPKDLHSISMSGSGYDGNLPERGELHTVNITHGDTQIELRDVWQGTKEAETVGDAVSILHPKYTNGLSHIQFTNDLKNASGQNLRANYNLDAARIDLSRGSDRNFAVGRRGSKGIADARATVLHELGHHVYNVTIGSQDRRQWEKLAGLSGHETIRQVQEKFAEQFVENLTNPTSTALSEFFKRFKHEGPTA